MNVANEGDDWRSIVDAIYEVTNEMMGRSKAYDQTMAKGLNIGGKYQVKSNDKQHQ